MREAEVVVDQIAEARRQVQEAGLRLAGLLRALCPGIHRFIQHRDLRPPWCPSCGYGQDGVRYRE